MLHTVVFFGASSSQAVHPDHLTPADLALAAAKGLVSDGRDFALMASKTGAQIAPTRRLFATAKEALDAREPSKCSEAVVSAVSGMEVGSAHASENLREAAVFLVACQAASAAGVDTRDAAAIFEASVSRLAAEARCFGPATQRLAEVIDHADSAARARTGEILKLLGANRRAMAIAGVA